MRDTRGRSTLQHAWRPFLVVAAYALAVAGVAAIATDDLVRFGRRGAGPAPPVRIYPTGDRVPANLLRLYLEFERPMSTGESREHLRLFDATGRVVERAFLQLEEELWDPTGRRLTVLFDPGRIKRGLRANIEDGPPLREGERYRLTVDAGWRDAQGRALGTETSRTFIATAADRRSPSVDEWAIEPPSAGTNGSLVVRFPEPLDRALLSTAIEIVCEDGREIRGEIAVSTGERSWRFTPDRPWQPGTYGLRVSSALEDVAGNSLERLFDADLLGTAARDSVPPVVTRWFSVSSGT
jgi:hypothetical protein